jgi:hypothetical protein
MRALRSLAAVDLRALALFRIGLGLIVLADLAQRSLDLRAHYTGLGVLPLAALGAHELDWIAVHKLGDGVGFQAALFGLHALCALALLVGVRTRVATLLCWLLALSLHARNPLVASGGDTLAASLLLLSLACPLGARLSLDALHRGRPLESDVRSIGTFALLLQAALVMWMTGVLKAHSPDWAESGMATYYALHARHTALGAALLELPISVLRGLSFGTLALELSLPLLLFCPLWTARLRLWVTPVAQLFLVTIWLTLSVGMLPLLTAVALLPFLPAEALDGLQLGRTSSLRSSAGIARVRDALAANRVLAWLSAPAPMQLRRATTLVFAVVLLDIVGYNVESLPGRPLPVLIVLRPVVERLGVRQSWPMFSAPSHSLHWAIAVGRSDRGETSLQHLTDDLEVHADPRARNHAPHGYRWLKLMESLLDSGDDAGFRRVGSVLCRGFRPPGGRGREVRLYTASQAIGPDYRYGTVELSPPLRVRCDG